jgi:hypothetical protein
MNGSAIENELRYRAAAFGRALREHDRGVVIGLILSIVPIPPVAVTAIVINAINSHLLARGRLALRERRLIHVSLILSVANLLLSGFLFAGLALLAVHSIAAIVAIIWHAVSSVPGIWLDHGPRTLSTSGIQTL